MNVIENIEAGKYNSEIEYTTETRKAWREDTHRLHHEVFKNDLFIEHGVTENPKANKAFEMAWDRGHSSGLEEVAREFEEIVELIK
jgi:hypothetical protein